MYPQLRPAKNGLLDTSSARLELVAQYKLNGNVSSMGVVRTSSPRGKQGCDSLLLAFNDAKVGLMLLNKNVTTQLVKPRCPCLNGLPLPIQLLLCQYITMNEMNTRYKKHMMGKNHSYWLGDPFVERVLEQSLPNWYPHWSTTTMRSTQLLWRQTCCSSFSSIG